MAHTLDIFLNNLAFAKGHIHDVFVNYQANEDFHKFFFNRIACNYTNYPWAICFPAMNLTYCLWMTTN